MKFILFRIGSKINLSLSSLHRISNSSSRPQLFSFPSPFSILNVSFPSFWFRILYFFFAFIFSTSVLKSVASTSPLRLYFGSLERILLSPSVRGMEELPIYGPKGASFLGKASDGEKILNPSYSIKNLGGIV